MTATEIRDDVAEPADATLSPEDVAIAAAEEAEERRQTALLRVVIGAVSIASLLLGAIGYLTDSGHLRAGELLVFCLVGLGSAPWQLVPTLGLAERASLTFLVGWSVLTAVPMLMGTLHLWHPAAAFVLVAAVALDLHVVGLWLAVRDLSPPDEDDEEEAAEEEPAHRPMLPLLLALGGALLCIEEAARHQHLTPGIWGFLPHIGQLWYLGLVLIGLAFVLAWPGGQERDYALPVLLIVLVLTLTPAIVYDGPRSQSAAKHVDLVMQIRTWHLPRSSVLVYNGWDGFFAAGAWLCDVLGLRDPMGLATFWPPLLAAFRVAALRWLFGRLLPTAYAAWAAVALAVLADPIGADYYSPQSVGFVVALIAFAIALHYADEIPRIPLLLLAGLLLAVTHQLSPYVAGGTLCVLVLFRQVRPWWLPSVVLAPAIGWALLHRNQVAGFLSLNDIGKLQNFRPPKAVGSGSSGLALSRLPVVGDTVRALLVGILVLAVIAGIALLRRRRDLQAWALAVSPAVGLTLVAVNPYGQEGIFRAMLFALPWLAVLSASFLSESRPEISRPVVAGLAGLLTSTFLAASFGLDGSNVVRPADLAAARAFVAAATRAPEDTPALLVLGSGDLPTSPVTLDATYTFVYRTDLGLPVGLQPALQQPALVRALTVALLRKTQQDPRRASLYALWSPVSEYYGVEYALQPPGDFAALRDAFLACGYWKTVFRQDGTFVFKFDPQWFTGVVA